MRENSLKTVLKDEELEKVIGGGSKVVMVSKAKSKYMTIACHFCGKNITVDIMKPSADCRFCGKTNVFDG